MAASTENVSAPTNASVSQDILERHVIKVGVWGQGVSVEPDNAQYLTDFNAA